MNTCTLQLHPRCLKDGRGPLDLCRWASLIVYLIVDGVADTADRLMAVAGSDQLRQPGWAIHLQPLHFLAIQIDPGGQFFPLDAKARATSSRIVRGCMA